MSNPTLLVLIGLFCIGIVGKVLHGGPEQLELRGKRYEMVNKLYLGEEYGEIKLSLRFYDNEKADLFGDGVKIGTTLNCTVKHDYLTAKNEYVEMRLACEGNGNLRGMFLGYPITFTEIGGS